MKWKTQNTCCSRVTRQEKVKTRCAAKKQATKINIIVQESKSKHLVGDGRNIKQGKTKDLPGNMTNNERIIIILQHNLTRPGHLVHCVPVSPLNVPGLGTLAFHSLFLS